MDPAAPNLQTEDTEFLRLAADYRLEVDFRVSTTECFLRTVLKCSHLLIS